MNRADNSELRIMNSCLKMHLSTPVLSQYTGRNSSNNECDYVKQSIARFLSFFATPP